jgi:hypothetical protein
MAEQAARSASIDEAIVPPALRTTMISRLINFLVNGVIAGVALFATVRFGLLPWVLYLSWVGYGLVGGTLRPGLQLLALFAVGAFSGWLVVALAATAFQNVGEIALPLALGLVVGAIALMEEFPPLDRVPAYFMGMVAFFAAGATPGLETMQALMIPAALGVLCGWLANSLRATGERLQRNAI